MLAAPCRAKQPQDLAVNKEQSLPGQCNVYN
jgi:hypothetical protein